MKVAYTSKVKATREPAAPMNVHVADLLDEIGDVIDRAEGLNVQTLILRPREPFVIWSGDSPKEKYLDGVQRASDIRRVHARVADIVGLHQAWERRAAPCPECDQQTLGTWTGSDTIACTDEDCGVQMNLTIYEHYCLERAREN